LVGGRQGNGASDAVGAEEDAHAADAEEDAGVLGDVVADFEEDEGDDDDDDYGPEVYELRGENRCLCTHTSVSTCSLPPLSV